MDLLNKLGSQLVERDISETLQLAFLGEGSDHCVTVSLLEERLEQAADSIFLVDGVTETFLLLESFLQILT